MKQARFRFGTIIVVLVFVIVIIILSLLTKNEGDIAKTIADIFSFFSK